MKVKTSDLLGAALDWAVGMCEGRTVMRRVANASSYLVYRPDETTRMFKKYRPSESWTQGGRIIDGERISTRVYTAQGFRWAAFYQDLGGGVRARQTGPTALIAAMRCFVASRYGDEVDIPEELSQ